MENNINILICAPSKICKEIDDSSADDSRKRALLLETLRQTSKEYGKTNVTQDLLPDAMSIFPGPKIPTHKFSPKSAAAKTGFAKLSKVKAEVTRRGRLGKRMSEGSIRERSAVLMMMVQLMQVSKTNEHADIEARKHKMLSLIQISTTQTSIRSIKDASRMYLRDDIKDFDVYVFDVVKNTQRKVVSTAYLQHIVQEELESRSGHYRKVLTQIIHDFKELLESESVEAQYALYGLCTIALCKENTARVAWDKYINDNVLQASMQYLSWVFRDFKEIKCAMYALLSLWAMAANSFELRSRLGSLGIVHALTETFDTGISDLYSIDNVLLYARLAGCLLSLMSQEEESQNLLWKDPESIYMILWFLHPKLKCTSEDTTASIHRFQEIGFQIVSNSSAHLSKHANEIAANPATCKLVKQVVQEMTEIMQTHTPSKRKLREIRHYIATLANISSKMNCLFGDIENAANPSQYVDGLRCLRAVLKVSEYYLALHPDDELHFSQNTLLVVAAFSRLPVSLPNISLELAHLAINYLIEFCKGWFAQTRKGDGATIKDSLLPLTLEILIDSISGNIMIEQYTDVIRDIVELLLKLLNTEDRNVTHSVAFHLARLRYECNPGWKLALEMLVERNALEHVLEKTYKVWDVQSTRLQCVAAVVTICSYTNFANIKHNETVIGKIIDFVKKLFDEEDALENTISVSNCAFLLWNVSCKALIENDVEELLYTIATRYQEDRKPIWELVTGALAKSLVDYLSNTPDVPLKQTREDEEHADEDGKKEAERIAKATKMIAHEKTAKLTRYANFFVESINYVDRHVTIPETDEIENESSSNEDIFDNNASEILANFLPSLPIAASPMLKKTFRLLQDFYGDISSVEPVEDTTIKPTVTSDQLSETSSQSPRMAAAIDRSMESLILGRFNVNCVLLFKMLRNTHSKCVMRVREFLKPWMDHIIDLLNSHAQLDAKMAMMQLRLVWLLVMDHVEVNENSSDFAMQLRYASAISNLMRNSKGDYRSHLASFLMLYLAKMQRVLHRSEVGVAIMKCDFHKRLLDGLHEEFSEQVNLTPIIACLYILSEVYKGFQQSISNYGDNSLAVLLKLANRNTTVDSTSRTLAIHLVILLRNNSFLSTEFYKCELADNNLRNQLKNWREEIMGPEANRTIHVNPQHEESGAEHVRSMTWHFEDRCNLVIRFDIGRVKQISFQILMQWSPLYDTEADLLPLPRFSSMTERLLEKPALIRGQMHSSSASSLVASFELPKKCHEFLMNGKIRTVPLEIIFVAASSKQKNPNDVSSRSIKTVAESENEMDQKALMNSIFASRVDSKVSGVTDFWNTKSSIEKCFDFDWEMCLRKPYFISNIIEHVCSAELAACRQELCAEYLSFMHMYSYYCCTDRFEDIMDVVNYSNIFVLSKKQYLQFIDDMGLIRLAPNLSMDDFEEIFMNMCTKPAFPNPDEMAANAECAVIKHQKSVAYLLRYQFLECIVHLAKRIFLDDNTDKSSQTMTISRAVFYLIHNCIKAMFSADMIDGDTFRLRCLYRKQTERVFSSRMRELKTLFNSVAGHAPTTRNWGGTPGHRLSMVDWIHFIQGLGLLNMRTVSLSTCNIIFLASILYVPDIVRDWKKSCTLIFVGFLEAILRLGITLPLPDAEQLHALGFKDVSKYYDYHYATNSWDAVRSDPGQGTGEYSEAKLNTLIDLMCSMDWLDNREKLRGVSWTDRMPPKYRMDSKFDRQVARDLHDNFRMRRGEVAAASIGSLNETCYKPHVRLIENVEVDVANTEFDFLPDVIQQEYLLQAYIVCDRIREELLHSKVLEEKERTKLVPMPRITFDDLPKYSNAASAKVAQRFSFVVLPYSEQHSSPLVGESDAKIISKLVSQKFELDATKSLYDAWLLRHPDSVECVEKVEFTHLDWGMRYGFVETSQVAVMRYVKHVASHFYFQRLHHAE